MENFAKFIKKYSIIFLALIYLIAVCFFKLYYAKTGSFLIDVGREAYIPWQMLDGNVLYKDIFNVYGPLSYQINAGLYYLFGINLNTLYMAGFVNSLLILFLIFYISKFFVNTKISLCITFLVMFSCVFTKTFFNFVFPYSYGAVYALTGFLFSLLFALWFIKKCKGRYLVLSFFFAGFSFANKIEYLPYFIFLFLSLLYFKPRLKVLLSSITAFFAVPVSSFGVLILQGARFHDFLQAFVYVRDIIKTPALDYFYEQYGLYFTLPYLKFTMIIFAKLFAFLIPFCAFLYFLNWLNKKYVHSKSIRKFLNAGIFFILILTFLKTFRIFTHIDLKFFTWIGLFCIAVLTGFAVFCVVKYYKNRPRCLIFNHLKKNEKMFLFLIVSAILISLKGVVAVSAECYGSFSLAVLLIPFTVFAVNYLPRIITKINKKVWQKTVTGVFVVVILLEAAAVLKIHFTKPLFPVITERGTIYTEGSTRYSQGLVNFLKQNVKEEETVLSLPEGVMLNFLAQRKSHNKYYYLIPVNVQLFGEDNIVKDLEKNPPDYFLLNSMPYFCFNTGGICDYAPKICDFISENYRINATVDSDIKFVLYKRMK